MCVDVVEFSKKRVITKQFALSPTILKSSKATRLTVLVIAWVAFLLRVVTLSGQSLWRDEVDAIRFSDWSLPELIRGLFREGHNGPLFFAALRPWRALTGDSEFALRYPSALLGTLAIPLGYILARQLGWPRRAGLLLGLLLATSPYLVWYGQEAKMYTLLLALVTLAFIAYLKALRGSPAPLTIYPKNPSAIWWLIFTAATSLSFYTHILSPLMLIVYGVTALLYYARLRRHWRGWLISMACLTLPYAPLAVWQVPLLLEGFQSGHPDYSAQEIISLLFQLYSSGLVRFIGLTGGVLYFFLLLSGLFLGGRERGRLGYRFLPKQRLILATWLGLPLLLVYLISLRVEVFEDRYLIYITPAFYLIVTAGLIMVRQYSQRLAGLCLGLILAINLLGIWQQQRRPIKADFRGVAEYLSGQPQPPSSIMIHIPYLRYTLNYYYKADYNLLEGMWTNDGKSEARVAAEMAERTNDLADLWLVVSEEALWDSRGLTRRWLDKNGELLEQSHFIRVDVYHYRLRLGQAEKASVTNERPEGNQD